MKTYLSRTPIRILAFTVIFAMLASLLPALPQEASAARNPNPSNPKTSGDTVTWDCVWFGHYPQSSDGSGGHNNDPIKWRVLSVNGDEALLLADKNLDAKPYNEDETNVTWETSTVRNWLNNDFMNKAFPTLVEKEAINKKTIQNPKNSEYETAGGGPTEDKIFFLSIDEVTNPAYGFPSDYSELSETRRALNTEYAKFQGAWASTEYEGNGNWWLRSPGRDSVFASYGSGTGQVSCYGDYVDRGVHAEYDDYYAVRPALYLNLESNLWSSAGTVSSGGTDNEVEYIPVESLQCEEGNLTLKEGEKKRINVKVSPTNASILKVIWTSSNESVATVDADGEVTAISQGGTTIQAKVVDGVSAQCQVTVTEKSVPPETSGSDQETTDNENQSEPSTEATEESKPAGPSTEATEELKPAEPSTEATEESKPAGPSTEATEESKPSAAKNTKPKKVTLSKVKSTKRGTLKLTWKRDKKATGYQAVVATDNKFKKDKKSAFITKNKTTAKTFSKLKRKKTYFAKVRAYKKMGKTKVYGAYSKVKKAKVK